jgi:aspartate kinase
MTDHAIRVIKVGGSVLTSPQAYRRVAQHVAARLIEAPDERLAVVVSAELGVTDALLQTAREFTSDPDPSTVDLLWSTGELRSVALLALALQALGVRATTANVHQLGLSHDLTSSAASMLRLRSALAQSEVVVIPGFLARGHGDAIVSLGRGGSDLTAVFLAARLRAVECELVKDVPGYFTADPALEPGASHLAVIDHHEALEMAAAGCELVQPRALEVARQFHVNIIIRALDDERRTVVTTPEKGHVNGVRNTHDTCGAAV